MARTCTCVNLWLGDCTGARIDVVLAPCEVGVVACCLDEFQELRVPLHRWAVGWVASLNLKVLSS